MDRAESPQHDVTICCLECRLGAKEARSFSRKSEAYAKLSRSKNPSPSSICALRLFSPKTAKMPLSSPPGHTVSSLYTGSIAIQVMKRGCQKFPMWSYLVEGSPRGHQGFLGVVKASLNRVSRGVPPIARNAPIMRDLGKLKALPLRSTSEGLSVLERKAILVGMYWGLIQKRICAYRWRKRGGFLAVY